MRSLRSSWGRMPTVVLALASIGLATAWPEWRDELRASGYYYGICGDGMVDLEEECDDGNTAGGDCCGPTCRVEPNACPCDDGLRCTLDEACLGGHCVGTTEPGCAELTGCAPRPLDGCRQSTKFSDVTLLLKEHVQDTRDELAWRWRRGDVTPVEAFGDPRVTEGYAFCMYEYPGAAPQLLMQAETPAGAVCQGEPCWRKIDDSGFIYRDRRGTIDGMTRIELETGIAGRSSVIVRGSDAELPMPTLPLQLPVTVQLQATNGECWEARYLESGVGTNDPSRFRGKAGAELVAVADEESVGGTRAGAPLECRPDLVPTPTATPTPVPTPAEILALDVGWVGLGHKRSAPALDDMSAFFSCDGDECVVESPPVGTPLAPFLLSGGGVTVSLQPIVRAPFTGVYDRSTGCGDGVLPLTVLAFLTSGTAVGELDIDVPLSTGTLELPAVVDCGFPFFPAGSCLCPGQQFPNACADGVCSAGGICAAGPFDFVCSLDSSRSCFPGTGTADCEDVAPGTGTCEVRPRPCFGLGIAKTGQCGSPGVLVSTFCAPDTESSAINTTFGLPGPVALSWPVSAAP